MGTKPAAAHHKVFIRFICDAWHGSYAHMCLIQILEHVAAAAGLNAAAVKQRNFISAPEQCLPDPFAAAAGSDDSAATGGPSLDGAAGGDIAIASDIATASDVAAASEESGAAGFPVLSIAADGTLSMAAAAAVAAGSAGNAGAASRQRPCFAGPAAGLAESEQVRYQSHSTSHVCLQRNTERDQPGAHCKVARVPQSAHPDLTFRIIVRVTLSRPSANVQVLMLMLTVSMKPGRRIACCAGAEHGVEQALERLLYILVLLF